MVNNEKQNLDRIFSALSDPTRRAMVHRLMQGQATVRELSVPFNISKPAITKHLKVLERAGLMERTVVGREHWCTLNAEPLSEVSRWLAFYKSYWNQRLDELDSFITTDSKER
ncbi:metalloregulator ArsR/SmtB family transcription factor [Parasalinivibrio latis]|uniref:ArsR/SmtB family transcription factor n=1 Tax=Parasalinivibrio latis TaxID=2952610 RepID=UPI0030E569AA